MSDVPSKIPLAQQNIVSNGRSVQDFKKFIFRLANPILITMFSTQILTGVSQQDWVTKPGQIPNGVSKSSSINMSHSCRGYGGPQNLMWVGGGGGGA